MNRFKLFMGWSGLIIGFMLTVLAGFAFVFKYPEICCLAVGLFLMKCGREDVIKFGKQRRT